jgi:hypothetical protein
LKACMCHWKNRHSEREGDLSHLTGRTDLQLENK